MICKIIKTQHNSAHYLKSYILTSKRQSDRRSFILYVHEGHGAAISETASNK